ncbi:MAG: DUF4235 domain-containing protein [Mycobacteriales bacterium]
MNRPDTKDAKLGWKLLAAAVSMLTALLTRKVLEFAWRKLSGNAPPTEPAHPDAGLLAATTWAGLSAALAACARVAAVRRAAAAWERASGSPPPI